MKKLTDFFLLCSGVNFSLIEQCPTERVKYAGLGATIFFTGVFAFFSAAFALYTVFNQYWIALALGLVWGFMIFNLDRYIVSSMRKHGKFMREFWSAVPRIIVAVIISVVIAKPLELRIFQKEIEPELRIMEQKVFAKQEQEVRARFTGTDQQLKSELADLERQLNIRIAARDTLTRLAQEEADGTGGSRRRNLGPIFKLKKADADKAEQELNAFRTDYNTRVKDIVVRLSQNDSLMQSELLALEQKSRDGLAARMEALSSLKQESAPIMWASIFIMLLLIAVETAPVFVKLISPRGPYDSLLKSSEFAFTARETEQIAEASSNVRAQAGKLMSEENNFVTKRLNDALGKA